MMCEITWVHTSSFPWNKHPRTLRPSDGPTTPEEAQRVTGVQRDRVVLFGWTVECSS